jgi:cyclohexyl-isocyanide hydratase
VCTGAFILGAAGLLKGRKATTNWTAIHLLPYFGAVPTDERYVVDGTVITTAGVTAVSMAHCELLPYSAVMKLLRSFN